MDLLNRIKKQGISIALEQGKLRVQTLGTPLSAELRAEIIANKSKLVELLEVAANSGLKSTSSKIKRFENSADCFLKPSFSQRRLWLIDQLQEGTPEYNISVALQLEGDINTSLLSSVFKEILKRHEILRTIYVERDGEVFQQVQSTERTGFEVSHNDIKHLTGKVQTDTLKQIIDKDAKRPFNLSSDMMLRVCYVATGEKKGVLLLNMHHIASDGWSMDVLQKEFFALYKAFSEGAESPLPELTIQYADYANWQHTNVTQSTLSKQLAYWDKQLLNVPPLHGLPTKVRPPLKQHTGGRVSSNLTPEVAKGLDALAKREKLTPFMLLHGALALVLSYHSNSHDIVIGTPLANREQPELAELIGFFVNTLVLRVDTEYELLSEYLEHIKAVHLGAQSNKDVPFEQLVERLKVPRSKAYSPLFQVMFNTWSDFGVTGEIGSNELSGISISPLFLNEAITQFDLDVYIALGKKGGYVSWVYDMDLFDDGYINQINDHMCRLLACLAKLEEINGVSNNSLHMLSEAETNYLLYELNDNYQVFPKDKCIHELFEQRVQEQPDKVALVFDGKMLTYQILNEKANQLAHYLKEHHEIKPDTLIGLCLDRSFEMVIGILGVLKSGGAYVPMDSKYPETRLAYMLSETGINVVVGDQSGLKALGTKYSGKFIDLSGMCSDEAHELNRYATANFNKSRQGLTSSNLAYVIFTSGSTGRPKGVMVEHSGIVNLAISQYQYYKMDEKTPEIGLLLANYCFDASVEQLFIMLLNKGNNIVVIPTEAELLGEEDLISLGKSYCITHLDSTPSHLATLLERIDHTSLRRIISGGEAISDELYNKTAVDIYNVYGLTEASVSSTVSESIGNIGKPIFNTQLLILNSQHKLLPVGVLGELYIGGAGLARGYLNRPELTAERFIDNPYYDAENPNSSKRLYRTGDLVRYSDQGDLIYIGRADEQVKIRGFRVELGELEACLIKAPGVKQAIVVSIPDTLGFKRLIAYVVSDKQSLKFINEHVKRELPEYLSPSAIILLDEMPLSLNGKIDKKALPKPDDREFITKYVEPKKGTEEALVEIWANLLDLSIKQISVTADFFELGGHSLLAVQLVSDIRRRFALSITVKKFFSDPTIRALAKVIDTQNNINSISEKKLKATIISKGIL